MGVDGIEVETHLSDSGGEQVDIKSLLVEYSGLFRTARQAAENHQAGDMAELSINTDRVSTVARLVSDDYFMVVALKPEGNYGKARYLLRIAAPKVRSEL
jgi:predicted regulator of Ras-like GTPase activity (Roadblock/LC7/MglB family)